MRLSLPFAIAALTLAACGSSENATPVAIDAAPSAANDPAAPSLPPETQAQLDQYAKDAEALVAAVDAGADAATLSVAAQSLMDQSVAILPAYLNARPECADYLTAAANVTVSWTELSPDLIERDYHRDEALPRSDITPVCYHMKDLVVHPATALSLLAQSEVDREKVREEIQEVAVHAQVVKQRP